MKSIVSIWLVALVLSAVFSCSGVGAFSLQEKTGETCSAHSHCSSQTNDNNEESPDACSPLCVCDCCCVPIELFVYHNFSPVLAHQTVPLCERLTQNPVLIPSSIWHPPRV